jgi:hypothetical protein
VHPRKGTILCKLYFDCVNALALPDLRAKFTDLGIEAIAAHPMSSLR